MYDIFVNLNFVGFFGYGVKVGCYFVLICGCYFVMVCFNDQVYLFYDQIYFRMDILCGVNWWNWEIIVFYVWMMVFVVVFVFGRGVSGVFNIVNCNM